MKIIYNKFISTCLGFVGAYCTYPLAEIYEKRKIHSKVKELKNFYKLDFNERKTISVAKLIETLEFAKLNVPYYKDIFNKIQFDPEVLNKDIQYFNEIPYLTKDIIREQGERLLSTPLESIRHYRMKTGGSTGPSAVIYYDKDGADYSAAITRYARQTIGDLPYKSELHFAASFARPPKHFFPTKDDLKHFSLNRTNIFFNRLDGFGLEEMWQILMERKPFLIHGHPSTLYALACHVKHTYGKVENVFNIFESSGELLQPYMREMIGNIFNCKVVDRYGLAEFGVIGYEIGGYENGCQLLDSEGWPEHRENPNGNEFVFTGFRNKLMPLIRYATGDMGKVLEKENNYCLTDIVGRIHDMVILDGIEYPTHHIMDVLDHKIGWIQEFQIDIRDEELILRIELESGANQEDISSKINYYWNNLFRIEYVTNNEFIRVGRHSKFRHIVQNDSIVQKSKTSKLTQYCLSADRKFSSQIILANGALNNLESIGLFKDIRKESKHFIITDNNIEKSYLKVVLNSIIKMGYIILPLIVPANEKSKDISVYSDLVKKTLDYGFDKHSVIFSLGGGVINNLSGFLASTLYRGIGLVHFPTSLLAQVDAAIDFKQAINHPHGKNLIGSYYPAQKIVIDPLVLSTLDIRFIKDGLAESIKHAICQDVEFLSFINIHSGNLKNPEFLYEVVKRSIELKLVLMTSKLDSEHDETIKQYGHAVGHAIEHLSNGEIYHGEAITIGMCVSAEIAVIMGMSDKKTLEMHYDVFNAVGLPTVVPCEYSAKDIWKKMRYDKHSLDGKIYTGLVKEIGAMALAESENYGHFIEESILEEAIKKNTGRDIVNAD